MKITNIALATLVALGAHNSFAAPHGETKPLIQAQQEPDLAPKTKRLSAVNKTVSLGRDLDAGLLNQSAKVPSTLSLKLQDTSTSATCVTAEQLVAATGTARINLLASNQDYRCFEDSIWEVDAANYQNLFNPNSIIELANHAQTLAQNYDGSRSNGLLNFIIYFRVAFWAHWANSEQIGDYGTDVDNAIVAMMTALTGNSNYYNTDEVHAYLIKETMILMQNRSYKTTFLPTAISWLQRYDASWGDDMQRLITQTLTLIFRGSFENDFVAAVEADRTLVNALSNFLNNNTDLLGANNEYQFNDAATELGRLLGYGNQTYEAAKVAVKAQLDKYDMVGTGSTAWLNLASQVEYLDEANCDYYGTCGYKAALTQRVLPITHTCDVAPVRVRAQEVTTAQLSEICDSLAEQETYFHGKLGTAGNPVADDNNSTLEVVVYNSSSDYKAYSGILFGHSTDNGGIYLEGDPAVEGNIPRFFSYEAEWLPEFKVWNLEHEFIHYMDGRYNLYGTFMDGYDYMTVWWAEGLAEYFSLKDYNDDAIALARQNTFTLSTLFTTTYDDSSDQIYRWCYLASRYFFERQLSDVDGMLGLLRVGNYEGYDAYLNNIGTRYDADFANWLQTVESKKDGDDQNGDNGIPLSNGDSVSISSDGSTQPTFYVDLPANASDLAINTSGGTGDADLYVKFGSVATTNDWDFRPYQNGNNEQVDVASPSEGRWHIMVNPYAAFTDVNLSVSWTVDLSVPDSCATQEATNSQTVTSEQNVCVGDGTGYFTIWVPEGQSTLTINTAYGDGDADVYHSASTWASADSNDNASNNAGSNEESITVSNPASGWHYITVENQGSGMTIRATLN